MTIIEAIKSGKRFKRKSWTGRDYIEANVASLDLRIDALVADDWEVEEKQITITETEFANAVWETRKKHCSVPGEHPADITRWVCLLKQELFKELGP